MTILNKKTNGIVDKKVFVDNFGEEGIEFLVREKYFSAYGFEFIYIDQDEEL
jgi:hypothetical protein